MVYYIKIVADIDCWFWRQSEILSVSYNINSSGIKRSSSRY